MTGGDFDLISCHGVISYLPEPERALRNLRRSLAPEGVLYLGVNGSEHFSASWRRFLPQFGFEMDRWPGGNASGAICDWRSRSRAEALARSCNMASAIWLRIFSVRSSGISRWKIGRGCVRVPGCICVATPRTAVFSGRQSTMVPANSATAFPCRGGEAFGYPEPSSFHRLIFTRQPEVLPPWEKPRALLNWRPLRTDYFRRFKWPARRGARLFKLTNRKANVAIEMRGAGWEVDLLRASDGERSIGEILAPLGRPIAPSALRSQLYLFYLLDLLNFLPPPAMR